MKEINDNDFIFEIEDLFYLSRIFDYLYQKNELNMFQIIALFNIIKTLDGKTELMYGIKNRNDAIIEDFIKKNKSYL